MRFVVTVRDEALAAFLGGFPSRMIARLETALARFATRLQSRVKQKLSDDVLHVRTGTLRRSINQRIEHGAGRISAVVGTNVEYAAAHEYGFHGTVSVRAHLRQIRERGRTTKAGKYKRGKLTGASAMVAAHDMRMNLPERSFLRASLKEMEDVAQREIKRAAVEALRP